VSEAQLRIEIQAVADQATREIQELQEQLNSLNRTTAGTAMGEQFQRIGGQMTAVGQNIVSTMSGIGSAVINVASEYETALASFSRISGTTGDDLDEMGQKFIDLSKTIPRSIPDLITIGEEASKIGVAKEGIIEFTELIAQMSIAFDISAGETGEAVGKLAANFGMLENGIPDMKRLETLGNVVNNLGDSLAAGEAGIIDFVKRTAGLYSTAGITETELAAFGATMQDVGIVPETSARAFEKFATVLARGKNNTENAAEGFDLLGLSMQKMQQMMLEGQGTEAMLLMLEAIKKAGPEAQIATEQMFGEFGGEAVRMANSANGVRASFEIMRKAMAGEGSTLSGGLETMSATFQSQMVLLQNSLADLGIAIASSGLLEGVTSLVIGFTEFIGKVADVNPTIIKVAVGLGVVVTAIGALLIPLGALTSIIGTVMTLSASGFFVGLAGALTAAASAAIAFLAPLAPIIGAILAVVASLIAVIAFINQFVQAVQEFGVVNALFMAVTAVVQAFGQIVVGVFTGAIASVVGFVAGLGIALANGIATIVGFGLKLIAAIASWIEKILGVPPIFSQALSSAANVVLGFVSVFTDAGRKLMMGLVDGVKGSVGAVKNAVSGVMNQVRNFLPFSDAKVGPLSDLTASGASIPKTMAVGMRRTSGELTKAMSEVLNFSNQNNIIAQVMDRPLNPVVNTYSQSLSNSTINNYSENITSPVVNNFSEVMNEPTKLPNNILRTSGDTVNNNSPVNVTINLSGNGQGQNLNFVEELRKEGREIAKIVDRVIKENQRTKYVRV
jgi:TP901 family phage tail tape measure protein